MYRIRLVLMGQQPTTIGEPVLPTQTIEGNWSKPGPIALTGQKVTAHLSGRKSSALALTGKIPVQRRVL